MVGNRDADKTPGSEPLSRKRTMAESWDQERFSLMVDRHGTLLRAIMVVFFAFLGACFLELCSVVTTRDILATNYNHAANYKYVISVGFFSTLYFAARRIRRLLPAQTISITPETFRLDGEVRKQSGQLPTWRIQKIACREGWMTRGGMTHVDIGADDNQLTVNVAGIEDARRIEARLRYVVQSMQESNSYRSGPPALAVIDDAPPPEPLLKSK